MSFFRIILFPFSLLFWFIATVRNYLYDRGIFRSVSFNIPVIAVGNLSTGGTGKTPQTEYLIRLLSARYTVAVLSRGYKRKSKGFVLADINSNARQLGDEPYQFYRKFPDITVAVDANRKNGIEQLMDTQKPEVILLDDAYQHRRVKAGFYILLTAYGDLYADDYVLPAGNLRESRAGAKRAAIIIVTKCPPDMSLKEQQEIMKKLKPAAGQKVYFTYIEYDTAVYSETGHIDAEKVKSIEKILVAGIAKPQPFFRYLQGSNDVCRAYPDHHDFSESEVKELEALSQNKVIITTEKDYMRLCWKLPKDRLFYLPIRTLFIGNGDRFDKTILDYVEKSRGNS